MKIKQIYVSACGALAVVVTATADVIYSGYQNLGIPTNFAGLYLDVNLPYGSANSNTNMAAPVAGWDINPFYGGKVLANSPAFQPVRSTTGNTSTIVNLAALVTSVGSGNTYSAFTQEPTVHGAVKIQAEVLLGNCFPGEGR